MEVECPLIGSCFCHFWFKSRKSSVFFSKGAIFNKVSIPRCFIFLKIGSGWITLVSDGPIAHFQVVSEIVWCILEVSSQTKPSFSLMTWLHLKYSKRVSLLKCIFLPDYIFSRITLLGLKKQSLWRALKHTVSWVFLTKLFSKDSPMLPKPYFQIFEFSIFIYVPYFSMTNIQFWTIHCP